MKKLTDNQLKTALKSHRKYLLGERGRERANFADCNLYGADLRGADLGSKTKIGRMLRLIGACQESVNWLDQQDQSDPTVLFEGAPKDWQKWLSERLGGAPSVERLRVVIDFIAGGDFQ